MPTHDRSFRNYVEDRLKARGGERGEVREVKDAYIRDKIEGILKDLKGDREEEWTIRMATIRIVSSDETRYLRPVYADPPDTVKTARDLSANNRLTYQNADNTLKGIKTNRRYREKGNSVQFAAIDCLDDRNKAKLGVEPGLFVGRIDDVCSKLASNPAGKPDACFFCVRAKERDDAAQPKTSEPRYEATHMLAIYLNGDLKAVDESALKSAHNKCQALFNELDAIMKLDSELFKLEGNSVVADVQPVFFNPDLAPADKIAFMIERLKRLLQDHLELHHLKDQDTEQEGTTGQNASAISVHYVSLAYELEEGESGAYTPIFQIYPHVYREYSPYAALRIAHPEIPSVSKFLLYHYFRSYEHNVARSIVLSATSERTAVLSESFKKVFESDPDFINILDAENRKKLFGATEPDQVHIHEPIKTNGGRTADNQLPEGTWKALNVVVDAKQPNKATVAFVIEGDVIHNSASGTEQPETVEYKRLPRAIVAIESPDIDFLSKSERETVRDILIHMSALIRHLFHDNSLLDYRVKLSRAYRSFVPAKARGDISRPLVARLLLCAMSIDVEALGNLLEQVKIREDKFSYLAACLDAFYRKLSHTIIHKDDIGNNKLVKDSIEARLGLAIQFVDKNTDDILKIKKADQFGVDSKELDEAEELRNKLESFVVFLEACPRNSAWAGYAPSLAEALGDRAEGALPSFSLIAPGFSAAGLYMAVVKDEIQQVAKLSSVAKLRSELDRYKRHVRYKVVAAARTPTIGLAFDTTGEVAYKWVNSREFNGSIALGKAEQETYDKRAYGVLISDLAAAEMSTRHEKDKTVRTLLNQIASLISGQSPTRNLSFCKNCQAAADSIDRLFRISTKLWRTGVKRDGTKPLNTIDMLQQTFRLERTADDYDGYIDGRDDDDRKGGSQKTPQYDKVEFPLKKYIAKDTMRGLLNFESHATVSFDDNDDDDDEPKMYAIVHGDLNSRNLAWSAALEHYILIDFEHTDIGIWGSDQARLVVNILVELYSGVSDVYVSPFHDIINKTCGWLNDVCQRYASHPGEMNSLLDQAQENFEKLLESWSGDDSSDFKDMPSSDATALLKGFIAKILLSFYHHDGDIKSEKISKDQRWSRTMRAMLEMAALKEFEYSLINVKRARLTKDQIKAVNGLADDLLLEDILRALYNMDEFSSPGRNGVSRANEDLVTEQKRALVRYFISYDLLKRLYPTELIEQGAL